MTTEPRRKRTLSGYLPDGSLVKIRTAAEYSYIVARSVPPTRRNPEGYVPVSRHYHADTAWKAAKTGDVIIGLTAACIVKNGPMITTRWNDGRITTYPRCYACDKSGLRVSTDSQGHKRPACAGRHRDNPARNVT